jgi:ABC-type phosphate/phosphonate transport system permease subunit
MLIWALFFTRAFGPGPIAGISAIFFTDTGTLGKLYSEALENIDDKQREGVKFGRRFACRSPALRRRAAGTAGLMPPVALFLGIEHPFGHHHRRRRRRRYRPQALGSDAHQFRLGKRRLYGAADPYRGVRLRQHLDCIAPTPDRQQGQSLNKCGRPLQWQQSRPLLRQTVTQIIYRTAFQEPFHALRHLFHA